MRDFFAEQGLAEQGLAEQGLALAEQGLAEQGLALAEQGLAEQGLALAEQGLAEQGLAEQGLAFFAEQGLAEHGFTVRAAALQGLAACATVGTAIARPPATARRARRLGVDLVTNITPNEDGQRAG
ncbi:hypothetical protein [Sphingomonas sp.]|uniref:hypothetical protein n=1 Tax=Sphingomonas sp. TaxID=28214 RepID=UPI0035A8E97C